MNEQLLGFVMVLTRISTFVMVIPVFGWKSIPIRIKISLVVLLTIFFSMTISPPALARQACVLEAILLIINEGTYGLALGLVAAVLFAAVRFGAHIVEQEMGLTMAEILDPLTGESTQPLGSLLEMVFILLLLYANGHHWFLLTLSKSYEVFPAGTVPTLPILAGGIISAGSAMFVVGLKLVAPILAASLLLMVVLAILARMVQEMNILFISLPLRVGLGLLMVVVFLPLMNTFVAEFADLMGKFLPL
jgi:flagellar biosynthetic protein FliR